MDDFHQVYEIDYQSIVKLTLDAGLNRFIPVRQHAFAIIYYL